MTRRLLFTLVLITTPLASHALGLGRLTVNSGLDEPFNGQIDLVSPTAQEIKTLKASLASRADFDIAGVERLALLFDITYAVKQHSNGQYYIKLATHNPVREPFLHFLIQVDWNGGHLIREYSALLDPPQWVAGTPAEIDVPATEVSNNKVVAESVPEAQAAPIVEIAPLEELPPLGSEPGTAATVSPDTMAVPESASINTAPESKSEPAAAPATVMPTEVAQAPAQPEATAVVEPFVPPATKSSPVTEPVPATQPVAVAPVTTAPVKSSMSEPEPAVVSELAPAPEPVTPAVVSMGREYGPTKSGDTLTQVARSMNVDSSLTSQQVMLALLRANPSAFFGNNVNNLKTGKILTLPDQETIASVSKVQAAKEYQAQYDAWQEYKLKMAGASRAVAVVEPEAPKVAEKPAVKKSEQNKPTKTAKLEKKGKDRSGTSTKAVPVDLLKIVRANLEKDIPEESSKTPGVETKKDAGTEKRALTERVATLEEAIESKQMQNKDMRERVGKLQEQVKNTERLVDLENKDLAVAQKQAAEAKLQAEKAAAEKAAAEKAAAEKAAAEKAAAEKAAAEKAAAEKTAQAKAEQEKLAQEQAAKDATSTAAKLEQAKKAAEDAKPAAGATPAKKPATAVKPAKAVPPPPAEVSFLDDILGNILGNTMLLAILGALAVVAVGVGAMYALRRRRAAQEFSESILSSSSLSSEASSITDGSGQAAASDTSFLSDFSQGGMGNIHTDEVDPIAEAEVYLAYGRDEQAEEILKDAIVKDPSRQELKGKLLEIYFQRNDVAGFETLAEELYAALEGKGGKVWDKAEEMGQKLSPANPMFRGGKPAARAAAPTTMLVSETTGQTLSEPQDMLEAMNATQGLEAAPTETNSGLDFNMDFNPAPADSGAQPTSTDFDMQFDMNESPASTASDNTSSFDLDFNPGVSGSTDTADHSIDFNLSGSQEPTQSLTSDLDFSPAESTSSAGELEFSLGGLSDTVSESDSPVSGSDTDSGMPGWDETATKLDLAKAYIDMGDAEGARSILDEVMAEGNDNQRQQAQNLAAQIAA